MITKIEKFKESFGFNIPKIQPKTKNELIVIIVKTIKNSSKGYNCDLNFIDTSLITDMRQLFYYIKKFNGDISKWDVSNVIDMSYMFQESKFNGDISKWDVSNVTNMYSMFAYSQFNGDISKWDVSNVTDMQGMFDDSPLESNPPHWYKNDI